MAVIGHDLREFVKALSDKGVVPLNCRRVIIDIPVDNIVRVFYECYGDAELACADLATLLEGVRGERVPQVSPKEEPPRVSE